MSQNDYSHQYVSRGGIKLKAALEQFQIDVKDKTVLDVGSSTGGFVDCLLQNGAAKVYSVDTAYGELAWKLRNDPKVVVMERTNILHLEKLPTDVIARSETTKQFITGDLHSRLNRDRDDDNRVDLITIDAGWTKLGLVLPVVRKFLKPEGVIIALLKPHYEADRQYKGGVVPEELVESIKNQVLKNIEELGFKVEKEIDSPILGGEGNHEFLLKIIVN
jgi:23S rRNA (cytidine1920-2'-O)/16S rRNA (cytidine1409-2'-O)-methyltransferase